MFWDRVMNGLIKVVDFLSRISVFVGGTMLMGMMLLTAIDVFLRYFFGTPIQGSMEITQFMMCLLVTFGIVYCAVRKGHIRVELVLIHLPRRANRVLNMIAYSSSAIFFILISWQTFLHAKTSTKLTSPVLFIPVYPFVYAVSIGMALLALVFIRSMVESIHEVMKK